MTISVVLPTYERAGAGSLAWATALFQPNPWGLKQLGCTDEGRRALFCSI